MLSLFLVAATLTLMRMGSLGIPFEVCVWGEEGGGGGKLTRNQNTPVWILLNIWRLGPVKNTNIDTNFSNKMLLNAMKFQGYNFYHFWVMKGVKLPPHPD